MRILLLDIETAPNVAYVWGLFKENIPLQRLVSSGYVLCWAAKWLGEEEIFFDSVHNSREKTMLKGIHKLLEEADAVVHYNGSNFDIPTLNKEFLLNGMTPPSSYKQIDLLQTARKQFRFTSNKLDYVANSLGVGKKFKHAGFELWIQCMNQDPEAWQQMEEYNKQDVNLLEKVYEIFLPWIKGHPNVGLYTQSGAETCPNCGGIHLRRRGFAYTSNTRYQRYRCSDCGTWSRSRLADKEAQRTPIVRDNT
jgi:DNA polymerase elongation subunit (family B)